MVFSLWLWSRTKSMTAKNTPQMLANLKAMRIRWCDAGHIAQWSTSVASCKATRCRHRASARAVSPRQPPWSTILKRTKNTNKTQLLPSFLKVDQRKKAKQFWDLSRTLYSRPWCDNPCCKPPRYVPYKCTYVPYNCTFGAPDQDQMLDVWG